MLDKSRIVFFQGNFSKSYGHSASVMRSQADSVRNVVTEELELVPDLGFSFWVSSKDLLVHGLVPDLKFGSWVSEKVKVLIFM